MHCELCGAKIFFKVHSKTSIKNLEEVTLIIKKQYKILIVLLLALLMSLGFFSALLNYLLFVGFKTMYNENVVIVSLVITGQVIFFILSLIIIGAIIKKFFLKQILHF
jgi:DNA-directed RNA polymerase subunit RPC12/RpoP